MIVPWSITLTTLSREQPSIQDQHENDAKRSGNKTESKFRKHLMFKNSASESHISDSGHQTHGEDRHNDKQKIIKTQYRNHGRFASGRLGIGTDCNYRIAVGWNARGRNLGFGRICSEKNTHPRIIFFDSFRIRTKAGKKEGSLEMPTWRRQANVPRSASYYIWIWGRSEKNDNLAWILLRKNLRGSILIFTYDFFDLGETYNDVKYSAWFREICCFKKPHDFGWLILI